MKKLISVLLATAFLLFAAVALSGCRKKNYELVLITDPAGIGDRGYNHGAWEGMTEFCIEKNIDCRYLTPLNTEKDTLLSVIRSAAGNGAKVIVTPGSCFEEAVNEASAEYPDVRFILLDGQPRAAGAQIADIRKNTSSILFRSEQSGYAAGYAAVTDGYVRLGFVGGVADADTYAYLCGYLQGAEHAAEVLGAEISAAVHFTGDKLENDANTAMAKKLFAEDADLIFVCAGDAEKSVIKAAEEEKSYVICSDTDGRYASTRVVTSAVKNIGTAVKAVLRSVYDTKDFEYVYGGKRVYVGAAEGCTGLASYVINDSNGNAFDRLFKFTKTDHDELLSKLSSGSLTVKDSVTVSAESGYATAEELTEQLRLDNITVTVIQ